MSISSASIPPPSPGRAVRTFTSVPRATTALTSSRMWVDAPLAPVGATPRSAETYAMRTLRVSHGAEKMPRPTRDPPETPEVDRRCRRRAPPQLGAQRVHERIGAQLLRIDGAQESPVLERVSPQPLLAPRVNAGHHHRRLLVRQHLGDGVVAGHRDGDRGERQEAHQVGPEIEEQHLVAEREQPSLQVVPLLGWHVGAEADDALHALAPQPIPGPGAGP